MPKEYGSDFPDQIFNSNRFELVQLTGGEIEDFKSKLLEVKTINAVSQGTEVLYFHSILKALWKFGVLIQKRVEELVEIMEREDNMLIKGKDLIFEP